MDYIETSLKIFGAISIAGGALGIIWQLLQPFIKVKHQVEKLQSAEQANSQQMESIVKMQRTQNKCLAALLNHLITGNGVDSMKKIRDELLETIIDE